MSEHEQEARDRLARDLRDAHIRANQSSDQSNTQAALIHLGLLASSLASQEYVAVGSLVGMVMGSMLDHGASLSQIETVMLGNRAPLHSLCIAGSRTEQLLIFLDFCDQQMERICRPGTSKAVIVALVGIFGKTVSNIGLASGKPAT